MSEMAIRIQGIHHRYGRKAVLCGVDLEVPVGSVTVLLGTNGAGKTTLLRLALGALRPGGGRVEVHGLDVLRHTRVVREQVGYVPDAPDAPGWMTLRDLCRFLAAHYPTWDQRHADGLAGQLGVPTRTRLDRMSKGEGMKAMLVAALAPRPRTLLLDEPFGGLDPLARGAVLAGVFSALRDEGTTVLVSTHELDVAARLAERVAILAGGRIARAGTVAEVLGQDEPARVPEALEAALAESVAADAGGRP